LDADSLDLTAMSSVTVPRERAIQAVEQALTMGLQARIVLIPYGRSTIVYVSGPDEDDVVVML